MATITKRKSFPVSRSISSIISDARKEYQEHLRKYRHIKIKLDLIRSMKVRDIWVIKIFSEIEETLLHSLIRIEALYPATTPHEYTIHYRIIASNQNFEDDVKEMSLSLLINENVSEIAKVDASDFPIYIWMPFKTARFEDLLSGKYQGY